jgi:hypothetical protein
LRCMSRSRKRQFMDDLEYYRQRYVGARLMPEEIIASKLKIDCLLEQELQRYRITAV